MNYIYPGQVVRIKTIEELCDEFDLDEEDIESEPRIGGYTLHTNMQVWCGGVYNVNSHDSFDGSIFLEDTDCWWSLEMVELVSEPGEFFGFKVGDKVEFRQYEDMENDGSIEYSAFVPSMRHLCGKQCTIAQISPSNPFKASVLVYGLDKRDSGYCLDTLMFEHVSDIPDIKEDDWSVILVS